MSPHASHCSTWPNRSSKGTCRCTCGQEAQPAFMRHAPLNRSPQHFPKPNHAARSRHTELPSLCQPRAHSCSSRCPQSAIDTPCQSTPHVGWLPHTAPPDGTMRGRAQRRESRTRVWACRALQIPHTSKAAHLVLIRHILDPTTPQREPTRSQVLRTLCRRNIRVDRREKLPTFAALEGRGCGEIGRHARLRIWCFGVGVRVPPPAHLRGN